MQLRQFNELEAARRGYTFLTATPPASPLANMPATFTQQVDALGTTISQIDAQASVQTSALGVIKDKVTTATEAAKELRSGHLVPLKKVAKLIRDGSTGGTLSPGFPGTITIPFSRNYEELLAAAASAVQNVAPYKDLFSARGLPTDFLDQIVAQSAALSQALQASGVAKTRRVATTKELQRLFKELRATVHVLGIGVTKACKADRTNGPTTRTAWVNATAVRKAATPTDIPFAPPTPAQLQAVTGGSAVAGVLGAGSSDGSASTALQGASHG